MVLYLLQIMVNLVCNVLCVILYAMAFYKYFGLQKASSDSQLKNQKGELSLICIGTSIFVINLIFAVYGLLSIFEAFAGGDTSQCGFACEALTIV